MSKSELKDLIMISDIKSAYGLAQILRRFDPNDAELKELERQVHEKMTAQGLPGPNYLNWLEWFHNLYKPRTYLEIGVETGQTLELAKGSTKAIGVDPEPKISHGTNAWCRIYKMTSDDFFKTDRNDVLGETLDLTFIDGLHYYEQALRDFINTEKHGHYHSVILLHDIAPYIAETATRSWNTTYWAGDTWKIMPILQKYRPELRIWTVPTYPTGLGVITGLNQKSTTLEDNFNAIVEEMKDIKFQDYTPVNLIMNTYDELRARLGK